MSQDCGEEYACLEIKELTDQILDSNSGHHVVRYKALFKCVIREGADKESKKLGDLAEGTIIKVVDYVTLDDGTERVQFSTYADHKNGSPGELGQEQKIAG